MSVQGFTRLCVLATVIALTVIVFGAYVRLSHAGLSCPDWPGCYGQLLVPSDAAEIQVANETFPERPVNVTRAWTVPPFRRKARAASTVRRSSSGRQSRRE